MTQHQDTAFPGDERLLTVVEAAEWLNTSERFPRRLIEERRIRFVRYGPRHVRIPESALREFIAIRIVEPVTVGGRSRRRVAA
ncbi:excisionase family DNA-binding protein [Spirillospora sp. NBC_01491]|uniref:excisionase family DNA-binding protein n=1 Tax=Spirillospora sp. NBC_01491 TaxID=2976007 RepID=UPI002E36B129|nr:excisionase family DNA-binding protein [Spirillospora sp. NBC_01491]